MKKEELPLIAFNPSGTIELTCPICGNYLGYEYVPLPRCKECGAIFDWRIFVYYEEKEENSEL